MGMRLFERFGTLGVIAITITMVVFLPGFVSGTFKTWPSSTGPAAGGGTRTYETWLADECGAIPTASCTADGLRLFHRRMNWNTGSPFNGNEAQAKANAIANNQVSYEVTLRTGNKYAVAEGNIFTYTISSTTGCVVGARGVVGQPQFDRKVYPTPFPSIQYYLQALNGEIGKFGPTQIDQGHVIAHSLGGDAHDPLNFFGQHNGPNQVGRWRRIELLAKKIYLVGGACAGGTSIAITFNDCPAGQPRDCDKATNMNTCRTNNPLRAAGGTYSVILSDACFNAFYAAAVEKGGPATGRDITMIDRDFFEVIGSGIRNPVTNDVTLTTDWLNSPADGGQGTSEAPQPTNPFSSVFAASPTAFLKPLGQLADEVWTANPSRGSGKFRKPKGQATFNAHPLGQILPSGSKRTHNPPKMRFSNSMLDLSSSVSSQTVAAIRNRSKLRARLHTDVGLPGQVTVKVDSYTSLRKIRQNLFCRGGLFLATDVNLEHPLDANPLVLLEDLLYALYPSDDHFVNVPLFLCHPGDEPFPIGSLMGNAVAEIAEAKAKAKLARQQQVKSELVSKTSSPSTSYSSITFAGMESTLEGYRVRISVDPKACEGHDVNLILGKILLIDIPKYVKNSKQAQKLTKKMILDKLTSTCAFSTSDLRSFESSLEQKTIEEMIKKNSSRPAWSARPDQYEPGVGKLVKKDNK